METERQREQCEQVGKGQERTSQRPRVWLTYPNPHRKVQAINRRAWTQALALHLRVHPLYHSTIAAIVSGYPQCLQENNYFVHSD